MKQQSVPAAPAASSTSPPAAAPASPAPAPAAVAAVWPVKREQRGSQVLFLLRKCSGVVMG